MVKFVKIFAAVVLVLCASVTAFAENYVEIDRTDRNVVYIDTDTIKDEGTYVTVVSKIELSSQEAKDEFKERSGVDADALLLTFAYHKEAEQDQFLEARTVFENNETGGQSRDYADDQWRDIPENSLGQKTRDWVIDYVANQK